jgi:hypothetical protein
MRSGLEILAVVHPVGLSCIIAAFVPGCLASYTHEQLTLRVIDAETQQPVPNARVEVNYTFFGPILNAPRPITKRTNGDGVVQLRVADFDPTWAADAEGYLLWQAFTYEDMAGDVIPKRFAPDGTGSYTHALYAEPEPVIEVLVPQDYQGLLKVEMKPVERLIPAAARRPTLHVSCRARRLRVHRRHTAIAGHDTASHRSKISGRADCAVWSRGETG